MKKILILITFITILFSQQSEITNIEIAQRTDGSKLVDIYFDITEDAFFDIFDISLEITFNQGESFTPLTQYLGDVSVLTSGTNYHIIWNFGLEYPDNEFDNVQIKLNATGSLDYEPPFEMILIPSGPFNYGVNNQNTNIDYNYLMMKYEVTYAQYAEFIMNALDENYISCGNDNCSVQFTANEYGIPTDEPNTVFFHYNNSGTRIYSTNNESFFVEEGWGNHPIQNISFIGALTFANYYNLKLPSNKEWEKAAVVDNSNSYPWGPIDTDGYSCANYLYSNDPFEAYPVNSQVESSTPVGFYNGENYDGFQTEDCSQPYGIYDLYGNVSEHIRDRIVEYTIVDYGYNFCVKGGSYRGGGWYPSNYNCDPYWDADPGIGFRCVKILNN